jgi:DNA-binding FadR family transcriptional regulator
MIFMTTDPPALRRKDWERPRFDRNQTRPEQAAEQLAAMAASAEAGDRLGTKEELRIECGVAVGTFNEALRMVQARGLVMVRSGPGGGLFASRQSPMVRLGNSMLTLADDGASLAEAARLRVALDPLLIQDAIEHASAHDIAALRIELDHMKGAVGKSDSAAFERANYALHRRIADISPSAILRSVHLIVLEVMEAHVLATLPADVEDLPDDIQRRYELHAALIDAIADRELCALELIRQHSAMELSAIMDISSDITADDNVR